MRDGANTDADVYLKDQEITDDALAADSEIAMKLKQFYTSLEDEAIPEKLVELLDRLDQVETAMALASNHSRGNSH